MKIATTTKHYKSLLTLCKVVMRKILDYKEQGNLITIPYRHLPVKSIDFKMETFQYDWEKVEYFDFYDWKSQDFVDFLNKEINNLPELDFAANEVGSEFQIKADVIKQFGLSRFINRLMKEVPNGRITDKNIDHYIKLFLSDYESLRNKTQIVWHVHLWLQNIFIESDQIEIAPKVFLRRPTKEQLDDVSIRSYHPSEFEQMTGRGLPFGAILSFTIQAGKKPITGLYPESVVSEIECWLNILRLFKPGGVISVYQTASPVSMFEYEVSENIERPFDKFWKGKIEYKDISNFKLYLQQSEEKLFKKFISTIKPILNGISHKNYLSGTAYDLALHRYNDALIKTEVNAYRILSSMTSIEALLSSDPVEITHKISLRTAKLLSYFDFNAAAELKQMKLAYTLRSKLVHGSELLIKNEKGKVKTDLLEWARENTYKVINFNRICLLTALQLKNKLGKSKMIEMIDSSVVDANSNKELKKLIATSVLLPIPYPFIKRQKVTT